ncbi:MAG: hypothetical protein HZB41_10165 [Ignavibacteriae bacterium]|nr:hypothetical protein [Ignavibacteriota bacterium]
MKNNWIDSFKKQFNEEIKIEDKYLLKWFIESIKFENREQFTELLNIMVLLVFGIDEPQKIEFKNLYLTDPNIINKFKVNKNFEWQKWLYDELQLRYGGIHYLSSTLGTWHRFVFGEKWYSGIEDKLISNHALDIDYHNRTYDLLTRKENVFLDEEQKERIKINIENGELYGENFKEISNFLIYHIKKNIYHGLMMHEILEDDKRIEALLTEPMFEKIVNIASKIFKYPIKNITDSSKIELFRKFNFVLYRTLLLGSINAEVISSQYINIIPITNFNNIHYATFVGIFEEKLPEDTLNDVEYFFNNFLTNINAFELSVQNELLPRSVITIEDCVRKFSRIPNLNQNGYAGNGITEKDLIKEELSLFSDKENKYGAFIQKLIEDWVKEKKINKEEKEALEIGIKLKFVGANSEMIDILNNLNFNLSHKNGKGEAILLYSEPGNGKETIAQLCHFLSKRWMTKDNIIIGEIIGKKLVGEIKDSLTSILENSNIQVEHDNEKLQIKFDNEQIYYDNILSYNFNNFHAGLLSNNNFRNILFGKYDDPSGKLTPGEFYLSHLTKGTLFLDEINTISEPKLSSWFLRTLEKPFSIVPENSVSAIDNIDVLTIFASNLSPYELINIGFNQAFISRLRTYNIPPLRNRVEDIPLLINKFIWLHKRNYKKAEPSELYKFVEIQKIDIKGLHILIRLPWRENIRELKRFIDDLIAARIERKITTKEISFDEIIRCIVRNEKKLLGK